MRKDRVVIKSQLGELIKDITLPLPFAVFVAATTVLLLFVGLLVMVIVVWPVTVGLSVKYVDDDEILFVGHTPLELSCGC